MTYDATAQLRVGSYVRGSNVDISIGDGEPLCMFTVPANEPVPIIDSRSWTGDISCSALRHVIVFLFGAEALDQAQEAAP